jgi:hypothetical protein
MPLAIDHLLARAEVDSLCDGVHAKGDGNEQQRNEQQPDRPLDAREVPGNEDHCRRGKQGEPEPPAPVNLPGDNPDPECGDGQADKAQNEQHRATLLERHATPSLTHGFRTGQGRESVQFRTTRLYQPVSAAMPRAEIFAFAASAAINPSPA